MEDKLQQFFLENTFDFHEPHSGHLERFERKLHQKSVQKKSWKWLSIAASVLLLVGFWLGNNHQKETIDLASVSPKMAETQNYFTSTITQEIKEVEKYRSLATEKVIEQALDQLEDLEDNYKRLVADLTKNGYEKRLIHAMINNYQERLLVLETVLEQIEIIKNPKESENEKIYL